MTHTLSFQAESIGGAIIQALFLRAEMCKVIWTLDSYRKCLINLISLDCEFLSSIFDPTKNEILIIFIGTSRKDLDLLTAT